MSRPKPEIILSRDFDDDAHVWDILAAESYYVITYFGKPVSIRKRKIIAEGPGFKYQKMTYTSLGSARLHCRRLNERFNCEDFDVMQVT